MIPAEAVEAAAKYLHDMDCRSALHSGFPADIECYDWLDEAKELLEAAAPYMLARVVTTRDELDALWLGSVILSQGIAYQRYDTDGWAAEGRWYDSGQVELPAKVLHDPQTGAAS